ncbi:S9 family peptidase, partial [Mycobacterium sp. AT1]
MTSPLCDLDEFLALPRVAGLAVSADGSRAVTGVSELNAKRTEFVTAIWELDVAGEKPARRLTRGAKGESAPVFTATGDLLFIATRVVPGAEGTDEPTASLWRLPAGGGEAVAILDLAGGVEAVHAARAAD